MGLREQLQWEDQSNAREGLMSAYLGKRTPEQSAELLNKARELRVTPQQAALVTPEEDAERLTNLANIGGLQAHAPLLVEKMREPNYANVVRENLGNMGLLESIAWKLSAGDGGDPGDSSWKSFKNSWTRATGKLFSSANRATELKKEIDEINSIQAELESGRTAQEIFASEEDPLGAMGMREFDKRRQKLPELQKEFEGELERARYTEWRDAQYPVSQTTRDVSAAEGPVDTLKAIKDGNTLQWLADIIPESVVTQLPQVVGAGVAAASGAPIAAAAGLAGLFSAITDYQAGVTENLRSAGVDFSDPRKAAQQLDSKTIGQAEEKAFAHALPVGGFDALSLFAASKVLLPKRLLARWAEEPAKRRFANLAVQMPVGGALGGAGEAGGQLAAEGKITSWADVFAEVAGEHVMAPLEVASTAMEARAETKATAERAAIAAERSRELVKVAEVMAQNGLNKETIFQHVEDVYRRAGVETITANAAALLEAGADKAIADSPALLENMHKAAEQGGVIELPPATALQMISYNPEIAGLLPFENLPSAVEAQLQDAEIDEATRRELAEAQARQNEAFKAEIAEIGRNVGESVLKATGSEEEALGIQALYQNLFGSMAQDLGVSPKALWESVGTRILGELDVVRDAKGNLISVEGKNPNVWANEAFNQSWGRLEKVKGFIVRGAQLAYKPAEVTRQMVAERLSPLFGKELVFSDGFTAKFSKASLQKMLSGKAVAKSTSAEIHNFVLSNIQAVAQKAVKGWTKKDRDSNPAITGIHRYFSAIENEGQSYLAKITVKTYSDPKSPNKAYSIESVEVKSFEEAKAWLEESAKSDGYEKPAETEISTAGGANAVDNPSPLAHLQYIDRASPLQDLLEALFKFKDGSFSQASKGDFYPTLKLIARWKNADRSTLLHESGHAFLETWLRLYSDLLKRGAKTAGEKHFAETSERVLKFLGIKNIAHWESMNHDQRRKAHEKFARSFEAWLMEGKAPKEDLVPIFARFKEWLKKIYICLAGIPGAQFDDSVQEMFSHMFLSEAQVREAKLRQNLQPMFLTAEEAGMTPEEFESYHQDMQDVINEAEAEQVERNKRLADKINAMRRAAMRDVQRNAQGLLKVIRDEEEKAFKQTRTYQAWDRIRNGVMVGDKKITYKITVEALKKMGATATHIKKLRDAHLAVDQKRPGQIPLDEIAVNLGYDNEVSMVADLLENLDPEAIINGRAVDRYMKENPEIATAAKMQDVAYTSIYNKARAKMLRAEFRALARLAKTMRQEATDAQVRVLAEQALSGMDYQSIKPQTYINAARRAARESRKAFAEGKVEEALKAKGREIVQSTMAQVAKEELSFRNKMNDKFKIFKKPKHRSINQEAYELIQRALANMDVFTEQALKLNPEQRLFADLIAELGNKFGKDLSSGNDEAIRAVTRGDTTFLNTPAGFKKFNNLLATLEEAGKNEQKVSLAGKKTELDAVQQAGSSEIISNADKHGREKKDWRERVGTFERIKNKLVKFGLSHARIAALMAVLDGSYTGLMSRLVVHGYDKCANTWSELQHSFTEKIAKALAPIEKDLRSGKKKASKIIPGFNFTTQDVFTMLLNYGNTGNIQRLAATIKHHFHVDILGSFDPKDPASVASAYARADQLMSAFFVEQLDDRFFTAAEHVWAVFDEAKAEEETVLKRMGERTPLWVEARKFRIGNRVMTGGYYPIVYDRQASLPGARIQTVTDSKSMSGALFGNQGVSDGHLQGRVSRFDKPLLLTTQALFSGLNEQLYFCAYAEYVNDMRKVFNPNGEIAKAIHERYGTEFYKTIDTWLTDLRENGRNKNSPYDSFADFMRRGVSMAGIGFNFAVAAIQVVGFTQSAAYLGAKWLVRGQLEALKHGKNANAWVCAKSTMMRDRARTQFREVNEIYSKINGGSTLMDRLQSAAYVPVTAMQMIVDIPTWIGGYQKALAEGCSEEEAVGRADRAVMNSQGSGRVGDLSGVERGGPWTRLFSVFYTFFNTALNLAVVSGKTESTMKAAAQIMTICVMQPLMEYVLREVAAEALGQEDDKDDDDEFWLKHAKGMAASIGSFNTGMIFGVREFASAMSDFGYRGPTGLRKIVDFGKAVNSAQGILFEDKEFTESALRNFISAFGIFAGIPVSPVNKAIKGYNLIEDGKSDSYFSLITGK